MVIHAALGYQVILMRTSLIPKGDIRSLGHPVGLSSHLPEDTGESPRKSYVSLMLMGASGGDQTEALVLA